MRKTLFAAALGLLWSTVSAQLLNIKTPTALLPSPEAANIIKAGVASLTLHSGAASTSIPFYELKVKCISVPVGLSSSTCALKVDVVPGGVGMNWSLPGSGVIARSVQGSPD